MATFPESCGLQQYSKELDSYEILAGRILDKVLNMRETVNNLHLELSILYKPIQISLAQLPKQKHNEIITDETPCLVSSKCAEELAKLNSTLQLFIN